MPQTDPRRQAQRERREQRRAAAAAAARKAGRRRLAVRVAAGIAGAAVVVGVGYLVVRPGPEVTGVERPPDEGRGHVEPAQVAYDDAAPTSGAHLASAPACGVAAAPLEPGLAVHALEHGAVVLWYDPAGDDVAGRLAGVLGDWDSHWIVSPNSELSEPIVATAWNRRMAFGDAADPALREFVDTYRERGPERVGCQVRA
ncbi:DUF3105 domain-containing protein [Jiangella alba]|uniref:DUF3105 domain-containing protein n=1 Tax=Jiangella alba TaxID=561176 RepID=A0A1H5Q0Z6_9ACTN|nr:DUF3105 domain-containing protein [Jiangella alba]SEF18907.1 Protein of unknown function [Jiangella alba]